MNLRTIALVLGLSPLVAAASAEDFSVLPAELADGPKVQMLHRHLLRQVSGALERRTAVYEKIKTEADARAYQKKMRDFFLERLGGFPERTPLNPVVTARIERDGYRVEKVVFASRPNFHVTGLLFLPPGKGPFPGVLVPCGHSADGKAEAKYQQASIALAKQGFVSFCYDPLGQGERHQVLLPNGKTSEPRHTILGVSCIPLGTNFAQFRIWDGIRAMDYLASRPEVDPARLGCTGNSGGGTLTSYLMALDERIVAAAPSCYITSFASLLSTRTPQDAEQNIYGQVAFGLTHAEYVMMRAPQPTLICTATRDMFDIAGSWEVYRDSKRFYARFGYPERVDLVETDEPHGFHLQLREGAVRWMNRWLSRKDEPVFEPPIKVLAPKEALATEKGQVLHLPGERTVFDINAETEDRLALQRKKLWAETSPVELRERIRKIAVIRPLEVLPEPQVAFVGADLPRAGYKLRRLTLAPEPGIALPAVALMPERPNGQAILWVDGAGKQAALSRGGELQRWAQEGALVLALDLRGLGELGDGKPLSPQVPSSAAAVRDFYLAYLLEKSIAGMWAEDILTAARWLRQHDSGERIRSIRIIGSGTAGPAVLHAAALETDIFAAVELRQTLDSWARVVRDRAGCGPQLINTVHGALQAYDLPDLRRLVGAGKLKVVDPRGSQNEPL